MLKSWKTRALATAGAVALAAPFAFMGAAQAVGGTALITTVTPNSGPVGQSIQVNGTGCTSTVGGATNTVELFLRGPGPGNNNLVSSAAGTVQANGSFTGTLTVSSGSPGDTFAITAQCSDVNGPGSVTSTPAAFTVQGGAILSTTGGTSGSGSTTLSGVLSGLLSGGTGTTGTQSGTSSTSGSTTGVATPITATPSFTG